MERSHEEQRRPSVRPSVGRFCAIRRWHTHCDGEAHDAPPYYQTQRSCQFPSVWRDKYVENEKWLFCYQNVEREKTSAAGNPVVSFLSDLYSTWKTTWVSANDSPQRRGIKRSHFRQIQEKRHSRHKPGNSQSWGTSGGSHKVLQLLDLRDGGSRTMWRTLCLISDSGELKERWKFRWISL